MKLRVALVTEVFHGGGAGQRLTARLVEAASTGARLAVLPEIPLDPWYPATRDSNDLDAEGVDGPRRALLSECARAAGIATVGGAIVADPADGSRHNTAITVDAAGGVIDVYEKLHLPHEPGFWEADHYEPGRTLPKPVTALGLPFGVQICSDANRPEGTHLLAAMGASLVVIPRATEAATWPRWRTVLQANAITSAIYVVSVNRPGPEADVGIGGPSVAVAPDGEIILETTDPLATVDVEPERLRRARDAYPGYLSVRSDIYEAAWSAVVQGMRASTPSGAAGKG